MAFDKDQNTSFIVCMVFENGKNTSLIVCMVFEKGKNTSFIVCMVFEKGQIPHLPFVWCSKKVKYLIYRLCGVRKGSQYLN